MTQQHLNGAQVSTSFKQMSGKAVAQGMGMNALALKAGAFGGLLTGAPENLGGDRMTRGMPSIAGKQPVGGLAPKPAPVDAQCIEQQLGTGICQSLCVNGLGFVVGVGV